MKAQSLNDKISIGIYSSSDAYFLFGMERKMEKDILTLRNIYRFLVVKDYPVFSMGIIREENRKGLTLTKFWQNMFLEEFRSQFYGKMVWRTTGGRNRFISDICNRSERISFYNEYARELAQSATPEVLLRQIDRFGTFLQDCEYSYEVFVRKAGFLVNQYKENDEVFARAAADYFVNALKEENEFREIGPMGCLFFCGWFLTMLMLHASSAGAMNEAEFISLRKKEELSPRALWEYRFAASGNTENEAVVLLTENYHNLCNTVLEARHFFGREEEMFDLREMLREGGKYLISGMGGVGKTELMRQFIQCCQREHLVDALALISYEGSLEESLVRAFYKNGESGEYPEIKEILQSIRSLEKKRVLIVIDNMDYMVGSEASKSEQNVLKQLSELSATVLITSRRTEIPGFDTYVIQPPSQRVGMLIFRDNYNKTLTSQDRKNLEDIIKNPLWCHTLTLKLLGCTARVRGWTVLNLKEQLNKGDVTVYNGAAEGQAVLLKKLYRRMYTISKLSAEKKRLLHMFSMLPYQEYDAGFVQRYICTKPIQDIDTVLLELCTEGWLEKHGIQYAMHPYIAECLLPRMRSEADYREFFDRIYADWPYDIRSEGIAGDGKTGTRLMLNRDSGEVRLARITLHALEKLTGRISEELLLLAASSAYLLANFYGYVERMPDKIARLLERCGGCSENTKYICYGMSCTNGRLGIKKLEQALVKQQEHRSIDENVYLEFCAQMAMLYSKSEFFDAKKAVMLGELVYESNAPAKTKITAISVLSDVYYTMGDRKNAMKWMERGILLGEKEPDTNTEALINFLGSVSALYLQEQNTDKARAMLDKMVQYTQRGSSLGARFNLNYYTAYLCSRTGEYDRGIPCAREAVRLIDMMYGGESIQYSTTLSMLGLLLGSAGQYEESTDIYEQALELNAKHAQGAALRIPMLLNYGKILLAAGQRERAGRILQEGLEANREAGTGYEELFLQAIESVHNEIKQK